MTTTPRTPTHPGGFIQRNYLDALGISDAELADALGIGKPALNRLLSEQTELSRAWALRLSKVLGGSPGSWMNMQTNHALAKLKMGSD